MDGLIGMLVTPEYVVYTLVVAAALGGGVGWWLRALQLGAHKRNVDAFESELVRAAGRARERARQERNLLEQRLSRIHSDHSGCTQRIERLDRQVRDASASIEKLTERLARARNSHTKNGNGNGRRKSATLIRPRAADTDREQPAWLVSADGEKDDLQTIRGLGPVIERRLNRLGICQYRQLARLKPEGISWIASQINVLAGRIQRDRWAAQARRMHFQKYKVRL